MLEGSSPTRWDMKLPCSVQEILWRRFGKSLDVMQGPPLRRTCLGQYQASSAALGWSGDGDCYLVCIQQHSQCRRHCTAGNFLWGSSFTIFTPARENFFLQKCYADDELRNPSTMSFSRQWPTCFDKCSIAWYYCFNIETHAEFPGRVVLSVRDIVGGVVRKFSWRVVMRENLCSQDFPLYGTLRII